MNLGLSFDVYFNYWGKRRTLIGNWYTDFLWLSCAYYNLICTNFPEKSRFRSKSRLRSGRFALRSVKVGQVEKNRPTPNTKWNYLRITIFRLQSLHQIHPSVKSLQLKLWIWKRGLRKIGLLISSSWIFFLQFTPLGVPQFFGSP